ncbi:DUF3152 domain-containing protein [Embleya sp. NPDC059259]|uniref:DUF3152 domain-containing protein n=1 Tax=unclassified Embleya TaxID=2699296 RepID=UPI0036A7ACCD
MSGRGTGRRAKPRAGDTRTGAHARSAGRPRAVRRLLLGVGVAAVACCLLAVVPRISDGGAPTVDIGATPLPSARPPESIPLPEQPSAQRDLPVRAPASQDPDTLAGLRFPLEPTLKLGGRFVTVAGGDTGPGTGKHLAYRVEIEEGLALDGTLFAAMVQQTLNDSRSWARDGLTFDRIDDAGASFVVRLSSPGTLHRICSPIVGDTSVSNVSCNANGTPWVMINGWRWAQGSTAYGDDIRTYRQMLINHEVGHRLGRQHSTRCGPGGVAPVMMQQTKSSRADNGKVCDANPWPYPTG